MSTKKRRFDPPVIKRLFDEPHAFEFSQCVDIVVTWLAGKAGCSGNAVAHQVRFKNSTSLAFPASDVESLNIEPATSGEQAMHETQLEPSRSIGKVCITPTFFGMLGVCGVLPVVYTDTFAKATLARGDDGQKAFIDTFSNRAVALYYEAGFKYRPHRQQSKDDRQTLLPLLLSLAGAKKTGRSKARAVSGGLPDELIAFWASFVRHRPVSTTYVEEMLNAYFSVPIRLESFIGCRYEVPSSQQSRLGHANALLGSTALVGSHVWQRDLRQRLTIGPLSKAVFSSFLPGKPLSRILESILTDFAGALVEYEVTLTLRPDGPLGIQLGSTSEAVRLGENTFLCTKQCGHDRTDVRYLINAVSPPLEPNKVIKEKKWI